VVVDNQMPPYMIPLMSKKKKLLKAIRNNPGDIRYDDACRTAELIGFLLRGQSGSHRTYAREGEPVLLNFQNVKGNSRWCLVLFRAFLRKKGACSFFVSTHSGLKYPLAWCIKSLVNTHRGIHHAHEYCTG